MTSPETRYWNEWNSAYRQPETMVPGSVPDVLGRTVVGSVAALSLTHPRILEIGCGTGWLADRLAALGSYVGWDLSDRSVELARIRFPEHRFDAVDVHDNQPQSGLFDVAVMVDTIAYFRDQNIALRNISKLLDPGGYLVLTTVNPFVYERMSWVGPAGEGQVRNWLTKAGLHTLLRRTGFDVLESRTIIPGGDQGILRWINSRRLNAPIASLVSRDRLTRAKEACGLGQYRIAVARPKGDATDRDTTIAQYD